MHLFYSKNIVGNRALLDEVESGHAIRVLRLRVGDEVELMDGIGHRFMAKITIAHHTKCELELVSEEFIKPRSFKIHIAVAPTKMNDRIEWFLEKATEIGIETITPVICTRSERKNFNHERMQKVILAAAKQSRQPWLPVLNELISLPDFIARQSPGFIAHCLEGPKQALHKIDRRYTEYCVLIGPEGDFTGEEIDSALNHKWTSVSLGESRLRTETAALFACMTLNLIQSEE